MRAEALRQWLSFSASSPHWLWGMDPMYLLDSGYYGQQFQTVDNSESGLNTQGYRYDQDQITSGGWLAAGFSLLKSNLVTITVR